MANEELPGVLRVFTRDEIRDKYLRDNTLRDPDAQVGPGSQPYVDASTFADQMVLVGYNAVVISNGTTDANSAGTWLDQRGAGAGVPRGEATGASGFVTITASAGGTLIAEGKEIRHKASRLRFQCSVTATYLDGAQVPVIGIDTGPETNLAAGEAMEWTAPPIGCGPTAIVFEQSDGTGLTGGRDAQLDPEYRAEIQLQRANPKASGNDAAYQQAVLSTPGIGIQAAFTVPAIKGPGTTGVMFTLRPATPGAGRRPNAAQLSFVENNLKIQFPGDDGIFMCQLLAQPTTVIFGVTWSKAASGWADTTTWPPYIASDPVVVDNAVAITPTSFRLTTGTLTTTPQVGQTIAFYDGTAGRFRQKRIGAVAVVVAGLSWDITCDTTNNASDTSYTPVDGQIASPWSESLNVLVTPILLHLDGLGPGEQVPTFFDPGTRQRRQPESPAAWPHVLTNRLLTGLFGVAAVGDIVLLEPAVPHATTIGTPGVLSYLQELGDLAVFEQ